MNKTQALTEMWDGRRWSITPDSTYGDTSKFGTSLSAVSCVSPVSCIAVGASYLPGNDSVTLVRHWNGMHWSVTPSPNDPDSDLPNNILSGVSCVSRTSCVAVGTASRGATIGNPGANRTLIEGWDGTRWSITRSPNPGAFDTTLLAAVSCTSEHCAAVGDGLLIPALALSGVVFPRSVTVSWTATEYVRLRQIAAYLHLTPSGAQKDAVYGAAYLLGLGSQQRTPVTLKQIRSGATYTTEWKPSEFSVIDSVRAKFAVGSVGATRLSVYLLSYLLALGGH
jgi:hypothetical protein